MKKSILILIIPMIWACSPDSQTAADPDFDSLVGVWKSTEDSTLFLNISQACCQDRVSLHGTLEVAGEAVPFGPQSVLTRYTVIKPDSGAAPVYVYEIYLSLPRSSKNTVCGLDGFVLGEQGNKEFGAPLPGPIHSLKLTKSILSDSTCASTQESLEFVKG